ncbi:hypothetical protein ACJRO0_01965 [Acetobacter oryzifermentans]|uniref:hypothetical protein n=1 Tax=Acetobacter oryzifermentans TaxID=1633874 RepID=UPI0039BFE77B
MRELAICTVSLCAIAFLLMAAIITLAPEPSGDGFEQLRKAASRFFSVANQLKLLD